MIAKVELPVGAEIAYPADSSAFIHEQLWATWRRSPAVR